MRERHDCLLSSRLPNPLYGGRGWGERERGDTSGGKEGRRKRGGGGGGGGGGEANLFHWFWGTLLDLNWSEISDVEIDSVKLFREPIAVIAVYMRK